jgi:hypothetical protein
MEYYREARLSMSEEGLWEGVREEYEEKVRKVQLRQGRECPEWTIDHIREHCTFHIADPLLAQKRMIRCIDELMARTLNACMRDGGGGNVRVDNKTLSNFTDLLNVRNKLMYQDASKATFAARGVR